MNIIKIYVVPFCCGILLLAALSGWAYREMAATRQKALYVMRESSEAVLKSLEGSIRSQVRRGPFARDRLQTILDNVVASTGITFVQFRLNNVPTVCAGICPEQLNISDNSTGSQHEPGSFILWNFVRRQDCPLNHNHKGRHHSRNTNPLPSDLDFRQQKQTLVVGISDRHYTQTVSEAKRRLQMVLGLGSFGVIVFLGAWCLVIRNRSLTEALTASHTRATHLEELSLSAAGLAHETKNPLGIIRGLAQRISKGNVPPQEVKIISESIMNEVDTASVRLNMFMAYAKS